MVFKIIKNFFKEKETKGDFYSGKDVVMKDCTLELVEDKIVFKKDVDCKSFMFSEICRIEEKNGTSLHFTVKHLKFTFRVSGSFKKEFVGSIKDSIKTKEKEVFSTQKVKYSIYNTERGLFDEAEEVIRLSILKDIGKDAEKSTLREAEKSTVKDAGKDIDINRTTILVIETEDSILHYEEISTSTQYYMDNRLNTFVWSVNKGEWHTFSVVFQDKMEYLEYLRIYVTSVYKKEEEEKYFERMEVENYHEEEEEKQEEYESCSEEESYSSIEERDNGLIEDTGDTEKNNHLVVGNNMTFVTRGSHVGIFKNTDNGIEFKNTIKGVLENGVSKIIPNQDSLIFLDEEDKKTLHKLDLERGKVVESWDINKNINDYFSSDKSLDSRTLIGLSDYSVFRIDPRTKEKVTESKDYKTKNDFSCGMATNQGHVAVVGKKGDLRLYDKIDKRAKSLIPGLGDEVKSVDVTGSGKYVICTCENFLLLYSVEGNYKNQVGKEKPVPKRLQLKPEHLAYIKEKISFTPARFSTDKEEESIVTSTGHYVLKWNLKDVLRGNLYSYQISKCEDFIVADNFQYGEKDSIIVTLPDDVRKVNSRILRTPSHKRRDMF